MVCQCTPPEEGGVGCGENCLNRMLSIECVAEQCPCGEACSNQQVHFRFYLTRADSHDRCDYLLCTFWGTDCHLRLQFQNRTYAPISMYRCGKKGFGLRLVGAVSKGSFIIEYVGEVSHHTLRFKINLQYRKFNFMLTLVFARLGGQRC